MPCSAAGLRQIDTAEKQHEFFVISRSNRDAPSPVNGRLKRSSPIRTFSRRYRSDSQWLS
jgi:hypothetical protein